MLADPDPASQAHSAVLSDQIHHAIIEAGGWIGFDRYMDMALYSPGLGYYASGMEKFGDSGDFVTAPLLGNQFAECIAAQCAEIVRIDGCDAIYEFGGGDGSLATGVLGAMGRNASAPSHYYFVETSADLRQRQQLAMEQFASDFGRPPVTRIEWLDSLPDTLSGVVLANELLDAMPCRRFEIDDSGAARELGVGWIDQRPCWLAGNSSLHAEADLPDLAPGYQGEWLQQAEAWVASIGGRLQRGVLLLIDYGFPRAEFYHPDRVQGTLMCHFQHRSHADPFFYPGLQDITCHVDFTAVARAGETAGLTLLGYTSQGDFLLACGLLDRLADRQREADGDVQAALTTAAEIKKLTMPHEMGEMFKVIAMGQGVDGPLRGFSRSNRMYRLIDD